MRRIVLILLLIALFVSPLGDAKGVRSRKIPCKIPTNATSCYWIHGRLGFGNGTPALRLWKIGTHRILGIYSGPSAYNPAAADPDNGDNENPELPANVERTFESSRSFGLPNRIFADFEVCPLEPERSDAMQAACIESAKNIVVDK